MNAWKFFEALYFPFTETGKEQLEFLILGSTKLDLDILTYIYIYNYVHG